LWNWIYILVEKIDAMVYGLTEDGVKVIEPDSPLSEVEYKETPDD
jgi:hypothetical protein